MTNQFRVWCKNKNEWERDELALLSNGDLWDVNRNAIVRKDTHIVEFATGIRDKHKNMIYNGDKVRHGYSNSNGDFFEVDIITHKTSDGAYMVGKQNRLTEKMVKRRSIEIIGHIHEGVK